MSARRRWLLILVVVAAVAAGSVWVRHQNDGLTQFGSKQLMLERAATDEARIQGLSGRERLPEDTGLLFIFDSNGDHCLWMKEMRFAIDMVWLDNDKKVVDIAENVTPETYPETFCSDTPARYVIEVNAGLANDAELQRGDAVSF